MRIYIVNTAYKSKRGGWCEEGFMRMINANVAAAWRDYDSEPMFKSIGGGDIVLLYENGRGYVAVGKSTGEFWPANKKNRIDRENNINGEEHQKAVKWAFYIPSPDEGFRGFQHGPQTCFSKKLDDAELRALWSYFETRGKSLVDTKKS